MCLFYSVVYKSPVEATTESEMQTVAVKSDNISTQAHGSEWMRPSDTQTDGSEWCHVTGTQTDQSEWLQCESTQTDSNDESHMTQTEWQEWLHAVTVQTDSSYWQSTVSAQTDVKQMMSTAAQTKEMRIEQTFTDIATETHANLSTQVIASSVVVLHFSSSDIFIG